MRQRIEGKKMLRRRKPRRCVMCGVVLAGSADFPGRTPILTSFFFGNFFFSSVLAKSFG
jgi:hypothetical protein